MVLWLLLIEYLLCYSGKRERSRVDGASQRSRSSTEKKRVETIYGKSSGRLASPLAEDAVLNHTMPETTLSNSSREATETPSTGEATLFATSREATLSVSTRETTLPASSREATPSLSMLQTTLSASSREATHVYVYYVKNCINVSLELLIIVFQKLIDQF